MDEWNRAQTVDDLENVRARKISEYVFLSAKKDMRTCIEIAPHLTVCDITEMRVPAGEFFILDSGIDSVDHRLAAAITAMREDLTGAVDSYVRRLRVSGWVADIYSRLFCGADLDATSRPSAEPTGALLETCVRLAKTWLGPAALVTGALVTGVVVLLVVAAVMILRQEPAQGGPPPSRAIDQARILELEARKEAGPDFRAAREQHALVLEFVVEVLRRRVRKESRKAEYFEVDRQYATELENVLGILSPDAADHLASGQVARAAEAYERLCRAWIRRPSYSGSYVEYRIELTQDDIERVSQALKEFYEAVVELQADSRPNMDSYLNVCMRSRVGMLHVFAIWLEYLDSEEGRARFDEFQAHLRVARDKTRQAAQGHHDLSQKQELDLQLLAKFADSLDRRLHVTEILGSDLPNAEKAVRIGEYLEQSLQDARRVVDNGTF